MSLYAKFLEESQGKFVYEDDCGYVSYSVTPDYIYAEDVYVLPEYRRTNKATSYGKYLESLAKEKNITKLVGSVSQSIKNPTASLKFLLSYGFKFSHIQDEGIDKVMYFVKNLGEHDE